MDPIEENLYQHVNSLCSLEHPRSILYPSSLQEAFLYIKNQVENFSLPFYLQKVSCFHGDFWNLCVEYPGEKEDLMILGAHYDAFENTPGADDNASGVAILLELIRKISQEKPSLPYSLEIVFYALEEPPYFSTPYMGSYIHAESLVGKKVLGAIVFEMVGYFVDTPNSQGFPLPILKKFYPSTGNFIGMVSNLHRKNIFLTQKVKKLFRKFSSLPAYSLNAPSGIIPLDLSDHSSYWKFHIPAIMVTDTAFYRNPHYHEITDTPDTLSYSHMKELLIGFYEVIKNF